ncbi:DUF2975 domain-containing protein [Tahibacter amnicola]|uniref:DUF2975 domain-containing protein n=1 Tax=Tahibacter amnicola TaxID=2976241 RepID=A0ABY6B6W5_9GAMM|nr:DUF2975 domain-containing protein [Tahibacter amnicola]UXI65841.1 DUF2975 domain-containing protein [Tahibacter amnicola]
MTRVSIQALALARPVIRALVGLNILYALLLLALLGVSFFIPGWPERPLGFDLVNAHPQIGLGLRAIVIVGLLGAGIVHTILRQLDAIVGTVHGGDPFVLDNAQRLESIAWRVAALEGLRLIVAAIAAVVWEPGKIDAFSLAPWLAVMLLFVLAGVFAHGARMRADLEGTV